MADGDGERAAQFAEYRRTGDRTLRDELIEANVGLATAIAHRYAGRGEPVEDLVQVAMLGLVKAVERFDPARALAFSSFAVPTLEGELKRHFRDRSWSVKVPRPLQERSLAVRASVGALGQRHGRSPTIGEIAADTGHSEEEVLEALEVGRAASVASLDATGPGDEHEPPADRLGVLDRHLERVELQETVARLLGTLERRDRAVVVMRFYEGMTQSQIATEIGVSQMQVSRLLARSLDRLRALAGSGLDT